MNTDDYLFQYGEEWKLIRKKAKKKANCICEKCKNKFPSIDLDVHHIVPISHFINEGYVIPGPIHRCFGVKTRRPWHVDSNIEILCMRCHAEEYHPHLVELYRAIDFSRSKLQTRSV